MTLPQARLRSAALFATLAIVLGIGSVIAAPQVSGATAAPAVGGPSLPVTDPFDAPLCEGATTVDPTENGGPPRLNNLVSIFDVADATRISRLEAYNAGDVVPMYDSFGASTPDDQPAFPPICGSRYVAAAGGAVSEWMFCTDYFAHTCADSDENGFGVWFDRTDVARPLPTATVPVGANPKLTEEKQSIVAYLIRHGYPYTGVGYYSYDGVTEGTLETTNERYALQTMVWCISDLDAVVASNIADPTPTKQAFIDTCAASINSTKQAAILALIPATPTLVVDLSATSNPVAAGANVRVSLETNVFEHPITVTSSEPLSVCAGPGVLTGTSLIVSGADPNTPETVELCLTMPASAVADVQVDAVTTSPENLRWNQADTQVDGERCQVYAVFGIAGAAATLTDLVELAPAGPTTPGPGPGPGTKPSVLPNMGTPLTAAAPLIAGVLVLGGLVFVVFSLRRTTHESS